MHFFPRVLPVSIPMVESMKSNPPPGGGVGGNGTLRKPVPDKLNESLSSTLMNNGTVVLSEAELTNQKLWTPNKSTDSYLRNSHINSVSIDITSV